MRNMSDHHIPMSLRVVAGVALLLAVGGLNLVDSNQNNYDAAKTQFNPNFYSHGGFPQGMEAGR